MENNANREKWINEALNCARGVTRVQPPPGLYEDIMSKLNTRAAITSAAPVKQWTAAAILLLAVNLGSVFYYETNARQRLNTANPLTSEMQSESTYNY